MTAHLRPAEAERLRRAEARWLEQARLRLRRTRRRHAPVPIAQEEAR